MKKSNVGNEVQNVGNWVQNVGNSDADVRGWADFRL